MNKPSLISAIERILDTELFKAPIQPNDPLGGLKPYKRGMPKYQYEGDRLIGLNLANVGLTDEKWARIVKLEAFRAEDIQALNLSDNRLTKFNFSIGLDRLSWLSLSDNQELSQVVFQKALPSLTYLDLRNCKIETFVPSFTQHLSSLQKLFLKGNPIKNISRDIYDQPGNVLEAVKTTLQAIEEDGEIPNDQIKLILLGNSTAGKSSLIDFLDKGEFEEERDSTHGIKVVIWKPFQNDLTATPEEQNLKVAIWDFGGQEFYHATHSLFFSDNALYLVLFERETNFQGSKKTKIYLYDGEIKKPNMVDLEHFPYSYWLDNIDHLTNEEQVPILITQNKCDKADTVEVDDHCKSKYGLSSTDHIFHISVKDAFIKHKNDQTDFSFGAFREKLIVHIKTQIARFSNSIKWQEIKNALQDEWKQDKVLSYKAYAEKCKGIKSKLNAENPTELETLTRQFHNQGILQHFTHIPELKDKVFVDPEWLTDCIYKVLDYRVIRNKGEFSYAHIEQVAETIEGIEAHELLALLRHFKLIFELRSPKRQASFFVAPQFLPEGYSDIAQNLINIIKKTSNIQHSFTLSYPDFLPVSTFLRFQAIYGNRHLDYHYNKNELVFELDSKVVMAKCTRTAEKRQISISIQDGDEHLRAQLLQELWLIDDNPRIQISVDGSNFEPLGEIRNPKYEKVYQEKYGFALRGLKERGLEKNLRPRQAPAYANGYALFIGLAYKHWPIHNQLHGTLNDIRDLSEHFRDHTKAAFRPEHITMLTEEKATASTILRELDLLAEKASKNPNATVIVYFSGHGETDGRDHFLVPYDFDLSRWQFHQTYDPDRVVSSKLFTDKLDAIQAKKCLVILDCCHAESMPADKGMGDAQPFTSPQFLEGFVNELDGEGIGEKSLSRKVNQGGGRVILTSCKADEKSLDLGTNGLFTEVLLECLNGKNNIEDDGLVRLIDMIRYIPKTVRERAKTRKKNGRPRQQNPMFNRIENLEPEDFIICAYDMEKAKGLEKEGETVQPEPFNTSKEPSSQDDLKAFKQTLKAILREEQVNGVPEILDEIADSGYKYNENMFSQIQNLLDPNNLSLRAQQIVTSTRALIGTLK